MRDAQLDGADALKELLEGGLLTTDRSVGKTVSATRTVLPTESLLDADEPPHVRLNLLHVCRFVAACSVAGARLRWQRIEDTIKAVEQRKRSYAAADFDLKRACELTAAFQQLRSLFPRNYICLFDSLALLEFLARYRVFPTWVFGIKLEPWAAHCWVQAEGCAFNEDAERAAGYTPIMTL